MESVVLISLLCDTFYRVQRFFLFLLQFFTLYLSAHLALSCLFVLGQITCNLLCGQPCVGVLFLRGKLKSLLRFFLSSCGNGSTQEELLSCCIVKVGISMKRDSLPKSIFWGLLNRCGVKGFKISASVFVFFIVKSSTGSFKWVRDEVQCDKDWFENTIQHVHKEKQIVHYKKENQQFRLKR